MKTILLFIITSLFFCFATNLSFAQSSNDLVIKQIQQDVVGLKIENRNLKADLKNQKTGISIEFKVTKDSIKNLRKEIENNKSDIKTISNDLGVKISANEINANNKIQTIDNTISKNTLYWIIAVLTIAFLSILLFVLLRKQVAKNKTDITANIQQTKKALEEESIKLDSKLVDLLATQMQLVKEERKFAPSQKAEEVNHELALKVADEIIRIQKNLGNMDTETKGLKQLVASIKRIQDNFEGNYYTIEDMIGKQYHPGMNVSVTFIPCDNGEGKPGEIVGIIKPQVNYKGVMIQQAQIRVCSE